ncbi:thiol-disulfide oxidoreductase ResA [Peribacillus castrilensis]|jgi:peroxiredoxin|uniref:Thiol-disulfide oxidoreductase n=1 Tax=Peribacillus simplex TaxID=1478 RepID=A0A9X8ZGD4_9BACI|nr:MULTISPECIES: thiol-disulfide oxidoreductase ResA [Bacillaceae]KRF49589.1 thiol-disulfide oxidoreductase [Bacillus sp. Soil745]MBD8136315.1 thiol-disulfide oxidoreductase ResA [Bacillus sp. CFBP 13597]MBL3643832.1 thiol-disulfide oxidoreductase ResA [Bacillus sp. RHFB]MBT2603117.1 thiol-disulfide oxidoreductase ResA [Bacillus sp. ISL-53]MCD1159886.1 thiol-disulfide oxidoreductase ResA [Peribacillus castrilensis]MDP9740273.1 peroxiredoxin [Bacillus sp. B2I3]PEF35212.1 thiol-disulfide oxido
MDKKKRRLISRTIILLLLGAALVFALYTNFTKDKNESLRKGSDAPNFVLTDMEGKEHKLSDYKGKGVFLNFWGTYCKPCEYEMPYMENQYKNFKDQGVEILAVNVGESDYAVNNFITKHDLTFPVMIDKGREVENAYRVDILPVSFLVDKEGKVIDIITGALTEESIQKHMERIKP